jgi:small subunit ribosomal protein S21
MAYVHVNPNVPIQVALNQFKKKVEAEGILKDLRKKEFYVKPGEQRKLKSINARKAAKKKLR